LGGGVGIALEKGTPKGAGEELLQGSIK